MNRRALLTGLGVITAGLSGCQSLSDAIASDDYGAGLDTENPINEWGKNGFLNRLVLYESGAARLEFADDYACFARIALGHTWTPRQGDRLATWELPYEEREIVVDMKGAIPGTKDISNYFVLQSLGSRMVSCSSSSHEVLMEFSVPEGWIE